MGKILIYIGIATVLLGVLVSYAPGVFKWFGKLPGDIHIRLENGNIFIPITSMIIISLVLTLVLNLFFRK